MNSQSVPLSASRDKMIKWSAAIKRLGSTGVEHLWDFLEPKIRRHNISNKDMLKSVLKDEWEKISAEETTKIVHLMPK
ncbi:hypothetical protein TNCV_2179951 [Trichonephila clavipes]|uniref:Uncharacterized protein n=1 Tax=Trichonephila clavipes TaxID=2585209 RepID=A0A8X6VUL5_TRICX|nr:hypothetical protein TNCV_2179951 [Trichonephila clavipes]